MTLENNPLTRFAHVYAQAVKAQPKDPNAVVLSTVGRHNRPSSRVVLMKGFDNRGFVFYTNTLSRKGKELSINPFASLCFYWPVLQIQVRVEGEISAVSAQEADAYFATRARGSQLGALASEQSEVLESREVLEARLAALEREFEGKPVPRPAHWSGYRLTPDRMEFWEARPNRLHERVVFRRVDGCWCRELLNP